MTLSLVTIFITTLTALVWDLLNRDDSSFLNARLSSPENRVDVRFIGLELRLHAGMMQVIEKLGGFALGAVSLEAGQ